MRRQFTFLLAAIGVTLASPAGAEAYSADYSVTLYGLPVAKARFDSSFGKNSFEIRGALSSAGLARVFDRTEATTTVRGSIGRNGPQPHSFVSNYTSGKKQQKTTISFDRGGIREAVNVPRPKKRGKDWIHVTDAHLRAALDPISSTLIRANGPEEVCNRTIKAFDGEMRADLKLTHQKTGPIRGFRGEAVTCSARFIPVAGYRKGRSQIDFLQNRSRITIAFMRLGDTGFYTPVDASVGTQIGTLRITASRIETR
ncbi:DUF3108 domain-containing protein [Aquamicrobium sp. LC103]|uniref:DUF3108 domain-containing protein n=1 Tax=Aquamicrobium sp. LC103 TaxID=1120658 RepID=UPI00063EBCC8|nr:DUF3108 domain-containing protein [Aquamicrobium sp. LC103]TKT75274.1 DUF3108 domain-containing protein [Aquamicrobium sp. LC103]